MLGEFFANHNIINIIIIIIGYLMPLPLSYVAFHFWHHYRTERFIAGMKWTLLEVQVPREVNKSPSAMELIFTNAFFHKSGKGFWEQYIQGAPWMWFSLEMVGIDGKVHFYIRTPSRIRGLVETQIYAQYPQAKVIESEDYVFHVPKITKHGNWYMWGCEYKKALHDARPIKTYRDMEEMESGTKEEYKVDPITPVIEFLGSLAKGEQVWIQIIVRQTLKKYHSHKLKKHVDFYTAAQEHLDELLAPYTKVGKGGGLGGRDSLEVRAPAYLDPVIKKSVRNLEEVHFDCGIRVVTLANKQYVSEANFNNLRRNSRLIWRQYASPSLNELERFNSTQFDSPFADPTGLVLTKMKARMVNFYRLRVMFHPPLQYSFKYHPLIKTFFPSGSPEIFVMSSEELATIFHFPGMVSEAPTFKRVESKIAKPPSNLPS
ncbi:hypothetical protein IT400_01040 [Candidatus Nomurabacteria bacterium]|nr:hypothetical protein [Candidatus Nomurabacteria bacterium]